MFDRCSPYVSRVCGSTSATGAASLTEAVEAALDGDLIRLAPGDHVVDRAIIIEQDITLIGAGSDQTTLTVTGESQALAIVGTAARVSDLRSVRPTTPVTTRTSSR